MKDRRIARRGTKTPTCEEPTTRRKVNGTARLQDVDTKTDQQDEYRLQQESGPVQEEAHNQ